MIEIVALIAELRNIRQNEIPMCKAPRNQVLSSIVFCEDYSIVLSKSRRAWSQIHCDVVYSSFDNPYELGLRIFFLEVQASKYAFSTHTLVVLDEREEQPF